MLFGNAMECALYSAGLISRKRKVRTPKTKTFPCFKCKGVLETIPFTNVAACTDEKCDNYFIFNH